MLEIATADLVFNDFHLETGREEEAKIATAEMKSDGRAIYFFFPHCNN